jgi:hypothetical protein
MTAVDDARGALLVNRSSRACVCLGRRARVPDPRFLAVAAFACLAYDILLTFPDEVRYIWSCVSSSHSA